MFGLRWHGNQAGPHWSVQCGPTRSQRTALPVCVCWRRREENKFAQFSISVFSDSSYTPTAVQRGPQITPSVSDVSLSISLSFMFSSLSLPLPLTHVLLSLYLSLSLMFSSLSLYLSLYLIFLRSLSLSLSPCIFLSPTSTEKLKPIEQIEGMNRQRDRETERQTWQ